MVTRVSEEVEEVMKKPSKFDVIMNIWISVIINVVLSIVLPIAAIGILNLPIFLKGFVIAFSVSTAMVFLTPIIPIGHRFAARFKVRPHSVPERLISTAMLALILSLVMSLLMTAVNAGIGPWFFAAWWSAYGWVYLSVYLSALLGITTGVPFTKAVLHIPKDADRPMP
jgi:hypothetical protein